MILFYILSFVLDGIISLFLSKNSVFLTLFSLMSLVITYPFYKKKESILYVGIILGLLYDIVYTQTLFLNTIIFLLLSLIILLFYKYIPYNIINLFVLSFLLIVLFRIFSYLSYAIIYGVTFEFKELIVSTYSSLISNFIYILLTNIFLKSKLKNVNGKKSIYS